LDGFEHNGVVADNQIGTHFNCFTYNWQSDSKAAQYTLSRIDLIPN
jgi:hypothetical protein